MVFDHVVKHNGIRYPAGADVPAGDTLEGLPFVDVPEPETETEAPKKRGRKKKADTE